MVPAWTKSTSGVSPYDCASAESPFHNQKPVVHFAGVGWLRRESMQPDKPRVAISNNGSPIKRIRLNLIYTQPNTDRDFHGRIVSIIAMELERFRRIKRRLC